MSAGVSSALTDLDGGKPMRVLLVEDDEFVREIVSDTLRDMGLTISEAPNGSVAIGMLRERPTQYDALVTDMTLPDGPSGTDVAAVMRELRPEARIVLISGSIDALDDEADAGRHTLAKPFSGLDLFRLLSPLLPTRIPID